LLNFVKAALNKAGKSARYNGMISSVGALKTKQQLQKGEARLRAGLRGMLVKHPKTGATIKPGQVFTRGL